MRRWTGEEERRGKRRRLKARADKVMKRMMRAVGKAKVDKEEIASITRKEGGRRCERKMEMRGKSMFCEGAR